MVSMDTKKTNITSKASANEKNKLIRKEEAPPNENTNNLSEIAGKLDDIVALNSKLDKIAKRFEESRMEDLLQNFANPWRVFKINFLVGLARGIGLTLGTALFFGILIYLLSQIVTLPLIGEYIAELLQWIDSYRTF